MLRDANIAVTKLQESVRVCEAEILQLGGASPAVEFAQKLAGRMHNVICAIEEVLCFATLGYQEVARAYEASEFMYLTW